MQCERIHLRFSVAMAILHSDHIFPIVHPVHLPIVLSSLVYGYSSRSDINSFHRPLASRALTLSSKNVLNLGTADPCDHTMPWSSDLIHIASRCGPFSRSFVGSNCRDSVTCVHCCYWMAQRRMPVSDIQVRTMQHVEFNRWVLQLQLRFLWKTSIAWYLVTLPIR